MADRPYDWLQSLDPLEAKMMPYYPEFPLLWCDHMASDRGYAKYSGMTQDSKLNQILLVKQDTLNNSLETASNWQRHGVSSQK